MPFIEPDPLSDALRDRLLKSKLTGADMARDSFAVRWAKFASIIIVSAVLVGGLFAISIHVVALYSAAKFAAQKPYSNSAPMGASRHDIAASQSDTTEALKKRFILGSGVGGVLGVVYGIRCLARKEDP